jgi:hypothetical protein
VAIRGPPTRQNRLAQRLLSLQTSGATKTASDKNKKSGRKLLHKQASKRPMTPRTAGFFLNCNPARFPIVKSGKGPMA